MLPYKVPPYVEIRLAVTESEKEQLRHQMAVLKSPADGMRRSDVARVAMEWRDRASMNILLEEAGQSCEFPGNPLLSLDAVQDVVKNCIMAANGDAGQWEVFYIRYDQTLARAAAGVRNRLATARMSEDRTQEFCGVRMEQRRPITYWLSVTIDGQEQKVEVAFYQENGLSQVYGENGWMVVPYPNQIRYLPADQPAAYLVGTYAIDPTELVESIAFTALKDEAIKRGVRVANEMHEPNGHQEFPDYKVQMDGRDWVVEVTRILGSITQNRVITMTERSAGPSISRAASQPGVDSNDVDAAIRKALNDKSQRREFVVSNELYCLLLVDVMDLIDQNDTAQWTKYADELTAFDSVVLAQIAPWQPDVVTVIKGSILSPDAAS